MFPRKPPVSRAGFTGSPCNGGNGLTLGASYLPDSGLILLLAPACASFAWASEETKVLPSGVYCPQLILRSLLIPFECEIFAKFNSGSEAIIISTTSMAGA
jgi:hypothetical protein